MSNDATTHEHGPDKRRGRDHLRLVPEAVVADGVPASPAPRARTIGRLIAQTALIADSAMQRRKLDGEDPTQRRLTGRLLRRFR